MKNILKGLTLSSIALLAVASGSLVVHAEEVQTNLPKEATKASPAIGNSTAEFTVGTKDDKTRTLTLDAVPDLQFGSTTVKEIATNENDIGNGEKGTSLQLDTNNKPNTVNAKDLVETDKDTKYGTQQGDDEGSLSVTNYAGVDWKLAVTMSEFETKAMNGDKITGATLTLNPKKDKDSSNDDALIFEPVTVDSTTKIALRTDLNANTSAKKGLGINAYKVSDADSATLKIPQQNVKPGTYQANLTWTLSNTYQASAAK